MRKILLVTACVLMIISAACSDNGADEYSEGIYEQYKNAAGFSAQIRTELNHGDYVTDYILAYAYTALDGHTITVLDPVSLSGLTVKINRGCTEITYAGSIFAPQNLDATGVTPIKLIPDMLESWAGGVPGMSYLEKLDGIEYIVQSFYSGIDGGEFMHRTWFDIQTLYPKRSETFYAGTCVMVLEFENAELTPATD